MTGKTTEVRFELRGADLERLIVVADDLEFLRDLPRDRLLSHSEVRLSAGILRRLLVDGQLTALWRPIGKAARTQPTVEATEIDTALTKWPQRWIRYAWAGGASTSVAHHTGVIMAVIPKHDLDQYGSTDALFEANPLPTMGQTKRLTVEQWLNSTSVAIRTNEIGLVAISRRSVIKYVANRKGGVHFDPQRNLAVANVKKRRGEIEHHLLDHGLLRVGHLSGPEYEVASMVQVVAASDWAQQFIEVARRAAPEDFSGDPYDLKFWTGMQEADGTGWATSRMTPGPGPTAESSVEADSA